jgi:hypothetical protein
MTTMAEVLKVVPLEEWVSVKAIVCALGGTPSGVSMVCADLTAKGKLYRRQQQVGMRYLYQYRRVSA